MHVVQKLAKCPFTYLPGKNSLEVIKGREWKIYYLGSSKLQIWTFHIFFRQNTSKKCTSMSAASAGMIIFIPFGEAIFCM